ncbi:cell wall elongation regulator TseB-like domain-containing protein [Rossellomorea aquimaris]|uniref:cell wall elongation regulator TseB-like domain-containing protein n=2 Tax=Rossellomorea aquimaris TaxID=189382 RepID=UPI0007D0460B|nr:DUF5590 domain-containing protein [Rossellomorea aquimaris]
MKKWLTIITILLLIVFVSASVILYKVARSPLNKDMEQAMERVKEETSIVNVENTSFYNGSKPYVVITGKDDKGEKAIAFVPNKNGKIIEEKWADGITKNEAINKLNDEKQPKELLSIRLGHESVGPVWEITYLDKNDHLNYYYILFSNGEWWRKIENL